MTDRVDSQIYALRRFDNVKTNQTIAKNAQGKWLSMRHPSIVSLYSVTQEKGALFFAHAFHPLAKTVRERFIEQRGPLLQEGLLWRFLTQLLMGMKMVHSRGMALRVVDANHVLLTSGSRFRFGCVGVPDVLDFESRKSPTELQIEDLIKLGILMVSIATRTNVTAKTVDQTRVVVQQHYSTDMCHVIDVLLSGKVSVVKICMMVSERVCDELDLGLASCDALHGHLRNEYENGRMTRLLLKLGFMNERPENSAAPAWSETGDRYILKLFRDYLFHQRLPDGTPVLDCGHVVSSLNKLDAGDPEQIIMSSRNGKDLLVASFSDIHRCLEDSFVELALQADPSSMPVDANYASSGGGMDPYLVPMTEPIGYPAEGRRGGRGGMGGYDMSTSTYEAGGGRARGGRGRGPGRGRNGGRGSWQVK